MILSLDLGSTSFKAALFDRRLREIRYGERAPAYRYAAGGIVEIPVAAVDAALKGAVTDALGHDGQAVAAVALTSQAQTFTLLDEKGRACRPFISWRDRRAEAVTAAQRLQRRLKDFAAHAGFGRIQPAQQAAQLAALKPACGARPALLPVYVLQRLTGCYCVDDNQAAMTGLYSLQTGGWWPRILNACGLTEGQLPAIVSVGRPGGATTAGAKRLGLPSGIPVVLAGNDQTAGAYGAEIERGGDVLLTLGTAIALYAHCPAIPPPAPERIRGPYPGGGGYVMTADGFGGALINWARTVLTGCATDDRFFASAAQSPPGARGLVFEPSMATGGGDWRGAGLEHAAPDFARALLECISRRIAKQFDALALDRPVAAIAAAGGGRRRQLWLDMIADRVRIPVRPTRGTPLRGAARMGVAFLGRRPGRPVT